MSKDLLKNSVSYQCPVCKAENSFVPFNGRPLARCSQCLCVERNRLMWLILNRLGLPKKTSRVLHCAPEYGIASRMAAICGDLYMPCDLSPDRYKSRFFTVQKLDLCVDLDVIPDHAFDLILHNHVLEHLPCSIEKVLRNFERILAPGGVHLFSVPIRGDYTQEDLSPDLSEEERRKRFGQEDHLRIFGAVDFVDLVKHVWKQDQVVFDVLEVFDKNCLTQFGIPSTNVTGVTGNSLFFRRKASKV